MPPHTRSGAAWDGGSRRCALPDNSNPWPNCWKLSQNLGGRQLVGRFDGGDITSDGGVLVLQKLEERSGIVRRLAACFEDYRKI